MYPYQLSCRIWKLSFLALFVFGVCQGDDKGVRLPNLEAMLPIGGLAGREVEVSLLGDMLSNAESVEFDCDDLTFQLAKADAGRIEGTIRIAENAALGPHILRAKTKDGYTNALWFTVGQFEPILEHEPNGFADQAQRVSPPCEVYGRMLKAERDFYSFQAEKGERWLIEVRAAQYGSTFESLLYLRDEKGKKLAYNDDRGDFDVNSMIDYTFQRSGTYFVEVDVFRGARAWLFTKNGGYVLRFSKLPRVTHVSPLGGRAGTKLTVHLGGISLQETKRVFLSPTRRGEYFTLTIPWTLPVRFVDDYSTASEIPKVEGKILRAAANEVDVEFQLPKEPLGTWSLFLEGKTGFADPKLFELSGTQEINEVEPNDSRDAPQVLAIPSTEHLVLNARLERRAVSEFHQDTDFYALDAKKGVPLHIYTIAYQLLAPQIDTVVSVFNSEGKLLAESDDLTGGRGFFVGSVDSNLYYIPEQDERIVILVSDRIGRGGSGYDYRLHVKVEEPGFHLIVSPQFGLRSVSISNFTVAQGGESKMVVSMIRMPPKTHPDDPGAAALAPPPGAAMEGEVRVWVEGLPPGVTAEQHKFRADEIVEPGGDGVTAMVPERLLTIRVADSVPPGTYPFRVMGEVVDRERIRAIGRAMDTMGSFAQVFNFMHRPVAETALTVVEPGVVTLELDVKNDQVDIAQGGSAAVKVKNLPATGVQSPKVWLTNAPEDLRAELQSTPDAELTLTLLASEDLPLKLIEDAYLEVDLGNRIVSTRPFTIEVFEKEKTY